MPTRSITVESGEATQTELAILPGRRVVVQIELPTEASWSELRVVIRDASDQQLYDGGIVLRADLDRPSHVSVDRTMPIGMMRVLVSTDTEVSADQSVDVTTWEEPFRNVQVIAR